MNNLSYIQHEFKKWTLLPLSARKTNKLQDKIQRKDNTFFLLSEKVFDYPRLLKVLKKEVKQWLKMNGSETVLSLAGYIYYLDNDFPKAEKYFYKCVETNSENLDNWVDLAFSLYHQGERKNSLAKAILFDFDLFIKEFNVSGCKKCNLTALEKFFKKIKKEKKSYEYNWQNFIIN